jgi:UMF1 family MFS transporter
MLGVALTAPALGAMADRRGIRKRFFVAFTAMCIGCLALFPTIQPGMVLWGFALATLANFGFESTQVYYNAYLIDVAPPERRGFVSGLGFAVGYLGSIIGLLAALPLVAAKRFDLVWLMVAAFFAVFAVPAFRGLPADRPGRPQGGTNENLRKNRAV